ncbi:MAG TPA: phage holin family protein [Burkholderiales bacterium]|nr:phage holin family protein [Burkholderiales bacterium]
MPDTQNAGRPPAGGGLVDSVKALLSTLVGIAHTRLELLSVELQEEVGRVAILLLWGALALFFAFLGVAFLGLVVVIAMWDDHRLLASGLVAGFFLLLAILAGTVLSARLSAKPRPFHASLGELAKDRDHLDIGP